MSESPFDGGPMGGPQSRPDGNGLPPVGGGLAPPGGGDSVDPMPAGGGDIGEDSGSLTER